MCSMVRKQVFHATTAGQKEVWEGGLAGRLGERLSSETRASSQCEPL